MATRTITFKYYSFKGANNNDTVSTTQKKFYYEGTKNTIKVDDGVWRIKDAQDFIGGEESGSGNNKYHLPNTSHTLFNHWTADADVNRVFTTNPASNKFQLVKVGDSGYEWKFGSSSGKISTGKTKPNKLSNRSSAPTSSQNKLGNYVKFTKNVGDFKKDYWYFYTGSKWDRLSKTEPVNNSYIKKGEKIGRTLYILISSNLTLTANWKKNPVYQVFYYYYEKSRVDEIESDGDYTEDYYYLDSNNTYNNNWTVSGGITGIRSPDGMRLSYYWNGEDPDNKYEIGERRPSVIVKKNYAIKDKVSSLNLYPVFDYIYYTVTFNGNGGSPSSSSMTVRYLGNYSGINNITATRTGFRFLGWFTTASGGTQITDNSTYNIIGNTTLFAHYGDEFTYTISFNKNASDATGSMSNLTNIRTSQNVQLTANSFLRTGYIFNGWNTRADGTGTSYTNGQTVSRLTESDGVTVVLYAKWSENSYTIKFDGNNSKSGDLDDVTLKYTQNYTLPSNPYSRVGYRFEGYCTSPSGSGTVYNAGQVINRISSINNDIVTLYAKWSEIRISVVYHNSLTGNSIGVPVKSYNLHNVLHINRGELNNVRVTESPFNFNGKKYYFIGWTTNEMSGEFIPDVNLNGLDWIRCGYNIQLKLSNIDLYSIFIEAKYLETVEIKNIKFNTPEITDDRLVNKRTGAFIYKNLKDIPPIGYFYLNWLSRFYKDIYNGSIDESYDKTPEGEILINGGDSYKFLTTTTSNELINNAVSRDSIDFDANWENNIVRITYYRNPLPGYEEYSDIYYRDYLKGTEITIKDILKDGLNWGIYGLTALGYGINDYEVSNDYLEGKTIILNKDLDLYVIWESSLVRLIYHRNTINDRDSGGNLLPNEVTKTLIKEKPDELHGISNGFKLDCISDLGFVGDQYFSGVLWYKFIGWGISKDTLIDDSGSIDGVPNLIKYDDFNSSDYNISNHVWLSKRFSNDTTYDNGITKDVHKYAIWESLKVTITYHKNQPSGTTIVGQQEYSYNKVRNTDFVIDEDNLSLNSWKSIDYTSSNEANSSSNYYYDFVGWSSTGPNGAVNRNWVTGSTKVGGITSDVHLYAIWEPKIVTVTYVPNGGTGSNKVFKYRYDSDQIIKEVESTLIGFTRTNYDFLGWSSKSGDNNTVEFAPGIHINDGKIQRDYTFYAVWSNVMTVTYHANGGYMNSTGDFTINGTLSEVDWQRGVAKNLKKFDEDTGTVGSISGWNLGFFTGWNTKSDGTGTKYSNGQSATFTKSTTLYAQWIRSCLCESSKDSLNLPDNFTFGSGRTFTLYYGSICTCVSGWKQTKGELYSKDITKVTFSIQGEKLVHEFTISGAKNSKVFSEITTKYANGVNIGTTILELTVGRKDNVYVIAVCSNSNSLRFRPNGENTCTFPYYIAYS